MYVAQYYANKKYVQAYMTGYRACDTFAQAVKFTPDQVRVAPKALMDTCRFIPVAQLKAQEFLQQLKMFCEEHEFFIELHTGSLQGYTEGGMVNLMASLSPGDFDRVVWAVQRRASDLGYEIRKGSDLHTDWSVVTNGNNPQEMEADLHDFFNILSRTHTKHWRYDVRHCTRGVVVTFEPDMSRYGQ